MTPAVNEQRLAESFSIIDDPHERLSAIVAGCCGTGFAAGERNDEDLVRGCISRVWLRAELRDARLFLTWDADSPLMKGLAGLVCAVFQDCPPAGAALHQSGILTSLGLHRQLSATRLHGLGALQARVRACAAMLSPPADRAGSAPGATAN